VEELWLPFDGITVEMQDVPRLRRQLDRVRALMADGQWRTLRRIVAECGGGAMMSEAGVSARLRDFRKTKFGGYTVERRRVPNKRGLFEYRVNFD
jgi:hypothetical protein